MDRSLPDMLATTLLQSRRTMLGVIVGGAATATTLGVTARKKKKKKTCKAPTTRCGKSQCCQPGQTCANGQCATPATTTPTPFSTITCPGPRDSGGTGVQRFAQTFVANGTGRIGAAAFLVNNLVTDIAFAVEIRSTQGGVPTATVLGTALAFNMPASGSETQVPVTFSPAVPVEQGVTYALVITDVAKRAFTISIRAAGGCSGGHFVDVFAANSFTPASGSLVFTVSP